MRFRLIVLKNYLNKFFFAVSVGTVSGFIHMTYTCRNV